MSGFWEAMRFTALLFRRSGAWRCAAFPGHLGLLLEGRDPLLCRGQTGRDVLNVRGSGVTVGAFLTGDLHLPAGLPGVLPGEPYKEAQELIDTGHLVPRGGPSNPATEENEDTEVGFPGAEPPHRRAVGRPMEVAMAVWASGRPVRRTGIEIPGVDNVLF